MASSYHTFSDLEGATTAAANSHYVPLLDDVDAAENSSRRRKARAALVAVSALLTLLGLAAASVGVRGTIRPQLPSSPSTVGATFSERIRDAVSSGVSDKKFRPRNGKVAARSYPWNNSMLSWQRSAFHFQPEQNWMNDPNGPMFYKGWYHFFYQYNPNGAVWGDIVWGHAASKDLIHWLHLPVAMVADQWYDINGVWTGSATILPDGQIIMLYTGSTNDSVQVQNLAYPADPSDPLLIKWVKYSENPVLTPPAGIDPKDFRDPTTAWYTPDDKWRIAIGSKMDKRGISLVYDTTDFKNYEMVDGVLHAVEDTGMWECVDFYPILMNGHNGLDTSADGPRVKHVFKVSMDDDRQDYYAIGKYDHAYATWRPDDPDIDVGFGLKYDYGGKYYAAKTFYDQKKDRRVLWGWIPESDSEVADVQKGWASLQAIPRTVVFDQKTGSNLIQWPVEEVESLRLSKKEYNNMKIVAGTVVPIDIGEATQLDIIGEFEIDSKTLDNATEVDALYNCTSSSGSTQRGALGPFGILVLANEGREEQTPVYFYVSRGKNGKLKAHFCTDQSRSSEAGDVDKRVFGSTVPVLQNEKLTVRTLVDHSIVESFAQGGRTCITSRVYPTKAIHGAARLFLFNNATNVNIKASLKVWHMNSAFIHPFSGMPYQSK